MFKIKKKSEKIEDKSLNLFQKISRLFIFLSIVLFLWIIIIAASIIINDMDPFWAYLSLENWVLYSVIVIIMFIIMEIIYYIYTNFYSDKIVEFLEVEPEKLHGKKIITYTIPKDSKGGVFSKTYIPINNENVLRIRNQMIPPEEL